MAASSATTIPHALPPHTAPRDSSTPASSSSASSIVTPHALSLSLPYPPNADPFIDAAPYHLLLAEIPAALAHSSRRAAKRRKRLLGEIEEAGLTLDGLSISHRKEDEQQELEARLEQVGAQVGAGLAERLSRDRPPLPTTLDILKFLCKDFWIAIWEKQVDGLRTNHRGVYVLQDHAFKPLLRISTSQGSVAAAQVAKAHLAHSVGLLRGALSRMGIAATVVAESPLSQGAAGGGGVAIQSGAGAGKDAQSGLTSPASTTFHVRVANAGTPAGSGGGSVGQPSER